jgi:hypothetical protein
VVQNLVRDDLIYDVPRRHGRPTPARASIPRPPSGSEFKTFISWISGATMKLTRRIAVSLKDQKISRDGSASSVTPLLLERNVRHFDAFGRPHAPGYDALLHC